MPSICATCHAFLTEDHGCEHIPDPYPWKRLDPEDVVERMADAFMGEILDHQGVIDFDRWAEIARSIMGTGSVQAMAQAMDAISDYDTTVHSYAEAAYEAAAP